MFLHEYAITPEVFSKEYCERDEFTCKELIYFLKDIRKNGMLANINKNGWLQAVMKYREQLSPSNKDKLSKLFNYLQDNHRIVEHATIIQENISSEIDWLQIAIKEDEIKPYLAILFTGKFDKPHKKVASVSEFVEDDVWESLKIGFEFFHSKENIRKYTTDFLLYAKKLTIIDPYFCYNREDEESLLLYAELFGKRRGERYKNRRIIIHTFYNKKDKFTDPDSDEFKDRWIAVCKKIEELYTHRVTINFWDDRSMHDRFMITNQGGISSGRGFTINTKLESYWSLIDDNELLVKKLNYFNQNANSNIKLIFSLSNESSFSSNYQPLIQGKVKKIIHDNERGKAGYIAYNGTDIYFQIPATNYMTKDIEVGVVIEFEKKETQKGYSAFIKKVYKE